MKLPTASDASPWIPTVIPQGISRSRATPLRTPPRYSSMGTRPYRMGGDFTASRVLRPRPLSAHAQLQCEALRELGLFPPLLICPSRNDRERIAEAIATQVLKQIMVGTPPPTELRLIDPWRVDSTDASGSSYTVRYTVVAWTAQSPPPTRAADIDVSAGWYPHDPHSQGAPELDLQRAPIRLTGDYLVRRQRPALSISLGPAPRPARAAADAPGCPARPGCAPAPSHPPR